MPSARAGRPRGRPPGTPGNKAWIVRNIVEEALGQSVPKRLIAIAQADPTLEKEVLLGLMPYCHPKLSAVEHSGEIDTGASQAVVEELKQMLKELNGL